MLLLAWGCARGDDGAGARDEVSPPPSPPIAENGSGSTAEIVARALPSVVNVSATRVVGGPRPPGQMFDHPMLGDPAPPSGELDQHSLGSGVIVSEDGVVLTNYHVVESAENLRVTLEGGYEVDAELIGADPHSDVAVLRLDREAIERNDELVLQPIRWGDSATLRLGDTVLAIGNPFGIGKTVSRGIVSATQRSRVGVVEYEDFIQTDAAINPGNSGGALINQRGELVGLSTAILSRTGGYQGIGFAIPTNMVRPILDSLLREGKVVRGWLGIAVQELDNDLADGLGLDIQRGALIADVVPDSPAARAGLSRGDVIVKAGGQPVRSSSRLRNVIAAHRPGSELELAVAEGGQTRELVVELEHHPEPAPVITGPPANVESREGPLTGIDAERIDAEAHAVDLPDDLDTGVLVVSVDPLSRAFRHGLRPGDVIVSVDREPVLSPRQLARINRTTGQRAVLLVYRDGATLFLTVSR